MIRGGVRVWVFCDIPESLAVVLPCLAHCPVFDGAPVCQLELDISLNSHLFPGVVNLFDEYVLSSRVRMTNTAQRHDISSIGILPVVNTDSSPRHRLHSLAVSREGSLLMLC